MTRAHLTLIVRGASYELSLRYLADDARPFDFLVDGVLLRSSLEALLQERQISAEALLEIEYIPAFTPPKPGDIHPHDEWVAAAAGRAASGSAASTSYWVASGSYDGILRFYKPGQQAPAFQVAAHAGAITALRLVPATGKNTGSSLMVSAGKDRTARLWSVAVGKDGASVQSCTALAAYTGAEDSIQAVAVSPHGDRCALGGWDGSVRLYRCGEAAAAAAAEAGGSTPAGKKKRKGEEGKVVEVAEAPALEPTGSCSGHTQCVSGLSWVEDRFLYTGSMDHTVRRWDLAGGQTCVDTLNTARAVHCIAACPASHGERQSYWLCYQMAGASSPSLTHPSTTHHAGKLVAIGGAERTVRVWDPRNKGPENQISIKGLTSHTEWVSSLSWCPGSEHQLVSGSYDGSIKVWDVRAAVPLATIEGAHSDKVLCVDWFAKGAIASGGADCQLRVHTIDL